MYTTITINTFTVCKGKVIFLKKLWEKSKPGNPGMTVEWRIAFLTHSRIALGKYVQDIMKWNIKET